MKNVTRLASATVLTVLLAQAASAQQTLTGVEALNDRIDDINTDVREDLARGEDAQRFGFAGVPQGWRGSVALTGSATSGNTDTGEISAAGRLTYGIGVWSHSFGLATEYARTGNTATAEKAFGTYEANRYFNDRLYAFGLARYQFDGFSANEHDAFVGFGPGYRIVNTPDVTWRVQAGPGVRYVQTATGQEFTEASAIVSSRVFYKINEQLSLTNDTDVLGSDLGTLATNDFGINMKMTDRVSTRVSYRTEYNSDPLPGFENTDNTVGVSLVIGF